MRRRNTYEHHFKRRQDKIRFWHHKSLYHIYIAIPNSNHYRRSEKPCKRTLLFLMWHSLNLSPRGNTIPWIGMEGHGSFILTRSQALESSHKVRWATSQGFIAPVYVHSLAQNTRPPYRTDTCLFGKRECCSARAYMWWAFYTQHPTQNQYPKIFHDEYISILGLFTCRFWIVSQ